MIRGHSADAVCVGLALKEPDLTQPRRFSIWLRLVMARHRCQSGTPASVPAHPGNRSPADENDGTSYMLASSSVHATAMLQ